MPILPVVTASEVLKALEHAGFFVHHTKGSHHALRHPEKTHLRITVPLKRKEIPRGTLRSIIRQAEMTVEEFIDLL